MADEEITQINGGSDTPDSKEPEESEEEILPANILRANITTEMQNAYLDYAMSVIVSRALPDVRDGLKPVHRRIIYAMQDQNMTANSKYHKSAAVVGEVLKKYHPHSDTSVYDAMVRMAQDFSLRYPLVDGQGNFGSIDNDPPAAMRYTEAKLQKISEELFRDIDKDTVNFELNDLQNLEPTILPSLLPNILLNGVSGIAVGMATNIPPHNLAEVIDGINLLISDAENIGQKAGKEDTQTFKAFDKMDDSNKETDKITFTVAISKTDFASNATVEDLVKVIKGPDFPTGGTIYDQKEIIQMYATGKGRIVIRAKTEIEEMKDGKMRIVVTEIPYQVNKATLVEKIAHLVRNKKIAGISDLRDESNRQGMRIVIELKKEALPQKIQNQLFKYTPLQSTFNANVVALLNGEPKLMTLKTILEEFVKHRQQVVIRRTIFLLKRAQAREHILLGLKIALDHLDAVIKLIRNSKDADSAKTDLMKEFDLTAIQAQAILDMQLRKLAALERQKIEDELKEIINTIKDFETLLAEPQKIMDTVQKELNEVKEKYGDARKTKVIKGKIGEISDEDLVTNEPCIVTISKGGYIKRMKKDTYKKQGRGGTGVKGQSLKEEDVIETVRACETHDMALFFTNRGKIYKLRIWDIPETSRTAKGTALVNFLSIAQNESVEAFLPLNKAQIEENAGFVVFGTEKGTVKKTALADFENIRTSGILAIKLAEDDNLAWVHLSGGNDEILMVTNQGQSIRFEEDGVRVMGRAAAGVRGIHLKKEGDNVVGMTVVQKNEKGLWVVVVTKNGYGKKTKLEEYKIQNRGGSGILTYKVTSKTGAVVTARTQKTGSESDMLIVSTKGKTIRIAAKQIPTLGRATQGVKLIKLGSGDSVASVAFLDSNDEEELKVDE